MNMNINNHHPDEIWIKKIVEPLQVVGMDSDITPNFDHEPSEEFLARCELLATQTWSFHRLKAEVGKRQQTKLLGLDDWLTKVARAAGVQLADAAAVFVGDSSCPMLEWPAASIGKFLGALGLKREKVEQLVSMEWFGLWPKTVEAKASYRLGATHRGRVMAARPASDLIDEAYHSKSEDKQREFKIWLNNVMKARDASDHETV